MLGRAAIRARIEGLTRILTLPPDVDRIVHLTSTSTVSAEEVAEEISTDRLLKESSTLYDEVQEGLVG